MTVVAETPPEPARLEHFPISFFGMAMGLFGLTLALRAGGWTAASAATGWVSLAVLILLGALYAAKAVRHPSAVAEEWNHPVRLAFFPAISISVLLLATFLRDLAPGAAQVVWVVGAAVQGVLTLVVITTWISHRAFGPGQLSPAWFIPAVGNVVVPLAGAPLGHIEISWYFFSVGLVFWLVLLTLVFNRLIFHDPLPGKLRPTLVILVAPPAVAFLAWLQLNGGQIDATARILLDVAYFFTLLVAIQVPALLRLPFALSFWALSFPLAAVTIASFRFAEKMGSAVHSVIGQTLLAVLAVTIAGLLLRTIRAAMAREICQPEG
ncbi:SLAC1 anion channel family protein [Stappia indica]|uniref:SLAC1 anion channel family protein n=1 Tax=Stappia indica TaxID=538381 RepID=UPI001CD34578|nr:SLAC1 anion channel family protein [Stappia indica]MCA1299181.1 SLAC1 anion channel family protein [Stappia indica]